MMMKKQRRANDENKNGCSVSAPKDVAKAKSKWYKIAETEDKKTEIEEKKSKNAHKKTADDRQYYQR
jgi:hypothetical protein